MLFILQNKIIVKYEKVLKLKNKLFILAIAIILSCIITMIVNKTQEQKNELLKQSDYFEGIIISNPIQKEDSVQYKMKVIKIEKNNVNINSVYLKIKGKNSYKYGDKISFKGEYDEPDEARNDKGFNYKQYLQSIGIIGTISTSKVQVIDNSPPNYLQKLACIMQNKIEEQIREKLIKKEHQDILLGILLGKDEDIAPQIKEDFSDSSLSHILAVSGMHVAYVITIVDFLLSKFGIGKRKTKILTIFFLLFFMVLTNNTPSVERACIMAVLGIASVLINQKNDIINNMAISLLFILIQNPFAILNIGLILSYSATLGIVLLAPKRISKKEEKKNGLKK